MTRDFIHINDFVILVEAANSEKPILDSCRFEEPLVAVAFYGSGNVDLNVAYGQEQIPYSYTKGLTLSFFADEKVSFEHTVRPDSPLQCIVIATALRNLEQLPHNEGELFYELLSELVKPKAPYVEGPRFYMTPEMERIVESIFGNHYTGKTKMMFFRSQVTALLSHFFGQLALAQESKAISKYSTQLQRAKEILVANLENPPSLNQLAQEIGLNTTKLKKEFKDVFGVPVFKFLQNERLDTAHTLIQNHGMSIQEAAWQVGYDSLGSFSNAFSKKFGYRPSKLINS
ncbi:helix-turn-helix transcriptional regulator [Sediminicola luteus]|uniref:Transcriptional regulator n=1 Tax=Sediminicola luteus TaxID=319238 RepID=A0A2A4G602_9FLAO|nr:AraC family transcriptional regulator [Sediminicola luteus]PCE64077.1 transcriptional regulator [Sediminicola luteus]